MAVRGLDFNRLKSFSKYRSRYGGKRYSPDLRESPRFTPFAGDTLIQPGTTDLSGSLSAGATEQAPGGLGGWRRDAQALDIPEQERAGYRTGSEYQRQRDAFRKEWEAKNGTPPTSEDERQWEDGFIRSAEQRPVGLGGASTPQQQAGVPGQPATGDEAVTPPTQAEAGAGAATPPTDELGKPVPDSMTEPAVDPWAANWTYSQGEGSYENSYAASLGLDEASEYSTNINRLWLMSQVAQLGTGKTPGGRDAVNFFRDMGKQARTNADGNVEVFYGGSWRDLGSLSSALQKDMSISVQRAQQQTQYEDAFARFEEYASSTEYGSNITSPFGDEQGWGNMLKDVFGDMSAAPDAKVLIDSFIDTFPLTDFSVDNMPGSTDHQRMTAFLNSLKEQGLDVSLLESDEPGAREQFLDDLRSMAASINPDTYFNLDDNAYNQIKNTELDTLIKQIERKGIMSDKDIQNAVNRMMKPAELQAIKDLNRRIAHHAAAGRGYSGAIVKATADMEQDIYALKLGKTGELFMDSIKAAEQGRVNAIQQLGQIRQSDLTAMLEKANLKGTLAGDYLGFLSDIGRLSVEEEGVAAQNYKTRADQHMKIAELELEGKIRTAGLELQQYQIDVGYDTARMQRDLEAAYRERGFTQDAAKLEAQQTVSQWEAAETMSRLVLDGSEQSQRTLVQMADLALRAQQGDREAWGQYQQLNLTEQLKQRGMDLQGAQMVADLAWAKYSMEENFDFAEWSQRYAAAHDFDMENLKADLNEAGLFEWASLGVSAATAGAQVGATASAAGAGGG